MGRNVGGTAAVGPGMGRAPVPRLIYFLRVPTDSVGAILTGNTWPGSSPCKKQLSSRIGTGGRLGGTGWITVSDGQRNRRCELTDGWSSYDNVKGFPLRYGSSKMV
jgi:hypothetical protein